MCPIWWVKRNTPLKVFPRVTENVHALKSSAIANGKTAVCFGPLEPLPNLAENEANSAGNGKGINVKVIFIFDFPVALSPQGHAISHGGSAISDSHSE